jgi:hypothetical protein
MKSPVCLSFGAFRGWSFTFLSSLGVLLAPGLSAQPSGRTLEEAMHHLGAKPVKDWPGVPEAAEGSTFRLEFNATANPQPVTLELRQRDVNGVWQLKINDRTISELPRLGEQRDCYHELPAGSLRDGSNVLEIVSDDRSDDVGVGRIVLHEEPLRKLLHLQTLSVRVSDAASSALLPARIMLEAEDGSRPQLYPPSTNRVAVREGLIYLDGSATFDVPAGRYRVAAMHGTEWSRDEKSVDLSGGPAEVEFHLRHEVDTTGFIAADTAVHTYTFSGHGDATVGERLLTLAGEGVELAVATDRGHNTDFRPMQEQLGLGRYFTPVTGAEITTANGHFNGFPLNPGDTLPTIEDGDWGKVVDAIRLKGARVVILNHPRWPDAVTGPFGVLGLNRGSGDRAAGTAFTFDAMELVNATVDTPDPMVLLQDWFALLDAGEKITAVASSDSDTMRDPVGMGRTYLPSSTDNPDGLRVDGLCESLLKGRASVSLGIFCHISVDDKFTSGDLVPVHEGRVLVHLRVASPGWIRPRKAIVLLNGESVATREVPAAEGRPTDATLTFELPVQGLDAHLIGVVLGDPVTYPGWKTLNNYTLAATNPVFLDVNGDGAYNSPRDSANRILRSVGNDVEALINTLEVVPTPVGVQMLALSHDQYRGPERALLDRGVARLAEFHPLFALYLAGYQAAHAGTDRAKPGR